MSSLISGSKVDVELFLQSASGRHYVYLLCRPDGTPFYVGKGSDRRVFFHERAAESAHPIGESNPFKCNVIRKLVRSGHEIVYQIDSIYDRDNEQDCLDRETELIAEIGRLHEGGTLTNLTAGVGSISGLSPHSIVKHAATLSGDPADNPERAELNRFLLAIGPVKSVPVKPIGQISNILPSLPHSQPRKPTKRCAYALVASACAHGLHFEAGVEIPRSLTFKNVEGIIENGVARDILKAGMAKLISCSVPQFERFKLNQRQCTLISELVGVAALEERGLL